MQTSTEKGHTWRRDAEGYVDVFAHEYEFHNGPYCEDCGEVFCIHCTPGWASTICGEEYEVQGDYETT